MDGEDQPFGVPVSTCRYKMIRRYVCRALSSCHLVFVVTSCQMHQVWQMGSCEY